MHVLYDSDANDGIGRTNAPFCWVIDVNEKLLTHTYH